MWQVFLLSSDLWHMANPCAIVMRVMCVLGIGESWGIYRNCLSQSILSDRWPMDVFYHELVNDDHPRTLPGSQINIEWQVVKFTPPTDGAGILVSLKKPWESKTIKRMGLRGPERELPLR